MNKIYPAILLLVGGIGLGGCGQVEQAANEAIEKAKQTATRALEDARQSGSIDQVREAANQALHDARQQAAGLPGHASEVLAQDPREQNALQSTAGETASAL
jgi:vacuolar-type H+-ATPase subunit H